ncbi:peptidylprolyl isomerase [Halomonas sp. TD01]|uniref:peptidylprolyl isomerase n=1 Tax=Halomonas sp. TD01 TaxID=999141 RepID=UPI000214EE4D|nr:peptidylprolyl isomerase [Halomonas sp. TD01]EGP21670.1 PpiC-type peptidyl-prolyl cis-trans isomerase [Halomonas sp. TD01]CAH1043581.1 Periplasmic chaperone and peptidyl-prolyl cis-trans isomerase of outer membrane proteins SurA (EC [Halomonas sp. TD01]
MTTRKTLLTDGLKKRAKLLSAGGMMALCLGTSATLVPLSVYAQNFESTQRQMLDSVVAVVNDGVIMRSELDDRIAQVEQQAQAQGGNLPPRSQLAQQVLERMVMDEIQLQMARQANLSVDDTELNRQVRSIAESNGMTLEEFADAVEADGMTLADVREEVRREILMRQVQQRQISQRVTVTDRDVERFLNQQPSQQGQAFIEEARARHVLVELTPTRNENQARARAEQARQRLQQGADFASVAREFSDDRGSAMNGGELGWVRPGQTVPAFEEAMGSLSVNQLSEPVRSQFGYHVIEVLERRRQDVTEESRREQVRQAIFQRRANEELQTWQREMREQAFVDIRL